MAFGAKSSSENSSKKGIGIDSRIIIKWLYWFTILAGIWFAYLNIQPYALIVKRIMLTSADGALIRLIGTIPIINGIAASVGGALHWFIGFILWAVIQTIEIFPIVIKRDRAFMRSLIQEADRHQKFQVSDDDDPTLASLKRWYNYFPSLTISRARNAALAVYAIDFMICITVYPPCSGGFGRLMYLLATGQWQLLDYQNILLLFVTLFVIEALVRFLFWLWQVGYFMREAHGR